jgi:hypothetical protein
MFFLSIKVNQNIEAKQRDGCHHDNADERSHWTECLPLWAKTMGAMIWLPQALRLSGILADRQKSTISVSGSHSRLLRVLVVSQLEDAMMSGS